jgi:TetR/AcrR family transcriptional repressor of nem operon
MPGTARARFNQGVANFRGMLASAFEALGKREPEALASSVLAEMVGAMALARAASDEEGNDILASSRRMLKERLGLN